MKSIEQLSNNIIGQLNGINKMIESKKDCFAVITQMKAVQSACSNLMSKYIEENLINCLDVCKSTKQKDNIKKLMLELTKK